MAGASVTNTAPDTMQVAVNTGKGHVVLEERPVPRPGPGELLVEVSHCGVCGSDIHIVLERWGKGGGVGGHEWSGTIIATGEGVDWQTGQRVIGGPGPKCGECEYCLGGHMVLCRGRTTPGTTAWQGAFARYHLTDSASVLLVPDHVPMRVAALTEPLAVALHGITNSTAKAGDRVLVLGAGPIGTLTIAALRAMGIDDVTACEPAPTRRELALAVGAHTAISPDDLHLPGRHEPIRQVDGAYDVVLECSGKKQAMEAGLTQLKPLGTLCLVGAGVEAPTFDPNRILLNELHITGAYCYDDDGFERALGLLADGELPTDLLIDPIDRPLAELQTTLELLAAGEIGGKAMIVPAGGPS